MTTVLAMVGLVLALANYEIDMHVNYEPLNPARYPNAMDDPRNAHESTNIIRLIILITSLLAIACLIIR